MLRESFVSPLNCLFFTKTNMPKFRYALEDVMGTVSNCSGIFLTLMKELEIAANQNKLGCIKSLTSKSRCNLWRKMFL